MTVSERRARTALHACFIADGGLAEAHRCLAAEPQDVQEMRAVGALRASLAETVNRLNAVLRGAPHG